MKFKTGNGARYYQVRVLKLKAGDETLVVEALPSSNGSFVVSIRGNEDDLVVGAERLVKFAKAILKELDR